jgi:hypothetical protein
MGLSLETDWAKPPVHLFLSIFLHNLHSEIPLPLCRNVEVLHHVVAAFIWVLQGEHPLNAVEIHFPENSCNTDLLNFS